MKEEEDSNRLWHALIPAGRNSVPRASFSRRAGRRLLLQARVRTSVLHHGRRVLRLLRVRYSNRERARQQESHVSAAISLALIQRGLAQVAVLHTVSEVNRQSDHQPDRQP